MNPESAKVIDINEYRWQKHCRVLFELPLELGIHQGQTSPVAILGYSGLMEIGQSYVPGRFMTASFESLGYERDYCAGGKRD